MKVARLERAATVDEVGLEQWRKWVEAAAADLYRSRMEQMFAAADRELQAAERSRRVRHLQGQLHALRAVLDLPRILEHHIRQREERNAKKQSRGAPGPRGIGG